MDGGTGPGIDKFGGKVEAARRAQALASEGLGGIETERRGTVRAIELCIMRDENELRATAPPAVDAALEQIDRFWMDIRHRGDDPAAGQVASDEVVRIRGEIRALALEADVEVVVSRLTELKVGLLEVAQRWAPSAGPELLGLPRKTNVQA